MSDKITILCRCKASNKPKQLCKRVTSKLFIDDVLRFKQNDSKYDIKINNYQTRCVRSHMQKSKLKMLFQEMVQINSKKLLLHLLTIVIKSQKVRFVFQYHILLNGCLVAYTYDFHGKDTHHTIQKIVFKSMFMGIKLSKSDF